jgi:hypothetical protein
MNQTAKIQTIRDPRVTDLARIGMGEGFSTYTGHFEGKPAFLVDCGTLADMLDEDEVIDDAVTVHVFEDVSARSDYLEHHLKRASPGAIGRR